MGGTTGSSPPHLASAPPPTALCEWVWLSWADVLACLCRKLWWPGRLRIQAWGSCGPVPQLCAVPAYLAALSVRSWSRPSADRLSACPQLQVCYRCHKGAGDSVHALQRLLCMLSRLPCCLPAVITQGAGGACKPCGVHQSFLAPLSNSGCPALLPSAIPPFLQKFTAAGVFLWTSDGGASVSTTAASRPFIVGMLWREIACSLGAPLRSSCTRQPPAARAPAP